MEQGGIRWLENSTRSHAGAGTATVISQTFRDPACVTISLQVKPDMQSCDDLSDLHFNVYRARYKCNLRKMVAHSEILLSKCAQFRDEGQFIDVRLKVREDIFPAHRIVLAANSDYFHAMFTDGMKESNQAVIALKDESISPDAFKIVMDSIYTGDLCVNEENVFEVLAAADHLQVTTVVQQCCDFLKREFIQLRLDLHNYCLLFTVADRHSLRNLQEAAEKKMASMYVDVCESEEFLSNVGGDQLFSLLSRDDLNAPSETFVFKSVMQWIKHKKEERMAVAGKVIGAVRLGLVNIGVVIDELDTEEMERVPEIHKRLVEALIHSHRPSRNPTFAVEKTKTRSTSPVRDFGFHIAKPAKSCDRFYNT